MSLVVERYLQCDTEGCPGTTTNRVQPNAFILRLDAKRRGWHITAKQDICPVCIREIKTEGS